MARADTTTCMIAMLGGLALVGNGVLVVTRLLGTWQTAAEAQQLMATMPPEAVNWLGSSWPWPQLIACTMLAAAILLTALYGIGAAAGRFVWLTRTRPLAWLAR